MSTGRPPTTRIGVAPAKAATRISGGSGPIVPTTAATLTASPTPAAARPKQGVTGIAGQRRQSVRVRPDDAQRLLAAAGVAPSQPQIERAIERFEGIVWTVGQPARLVEEAERMGQPAQHRLRQLCDAVLAVQQSRHAGDLGHHLGRIHDLLNAAGERMAGEGVRNAVLDWMGGEAMPAATADELRMLQHEVSRLQVPIDAEIASLARLQADCEAVAEDIAAWAVACHFTPLAEPGTSPPVLATIAHLRLESLLRSQALAVQQRHIVGQSIDHLRALRARAHDAVLTDLPAWLGAVAALRSRPNPTERYALRARLQAMTERLAV